MYKVKRKHKISNTDFNRIFPNRTFNKRDKIIRAIFIVEDTDGNYHVEEHPTVLGYLFYSTVLLGIFFPVLIMEGIKGLCGLKYEVVTMIKRKPLRGDQLKHNIKTTAQLLELTNWYN